MLSTFGTPLRAAAFALGGVLLAWIWYDGDRRLAVGLCLVVVVVVAASQLIAARLVTKVPTTALHLMEFRIVGIGMASAVAAALAIIIGVEVSVDDEAVAETKKLVTAAATALSGFVSAVVITADKSDSEIGSYVKKQFQSRFTSTKPAPPGKRWVPVGSVAQLAVFSSYERGWTDWSLDNRRARIAALVADLETPPTDYE